MDRVEKQLIEELGFGTCSGCDYENESKDIVGSTCHMCMRNPHDNRLDWYRQEKEA